MNSNEQRAIHHVNKALDAIEEYRRKLAMAHDVTKGTAYRVNEIQEIIDLLHEVAAHIDPHADDPWVYQTPLPF